MSIFIASNCVQSVWRLYLSIRSFDDDASRSDASSSGDGVGDGRRRLSKQGSRDEYVNVNDAECCPRCGRRVFFAEQVLCLARKWHKSCFTCGEPPGWGGGVIGGAGREAAQLILRFSISEPVSRAESCPVPEVVSNFQHCHLAHIYVFE